MTQDHQRRIGKNTMIKNNNKKFKNKKAEYGTDTQFDYFHCRD